MQDKKKIKLLEGGEGLGVEHVGGRVGEQRLDDERWEARRYDGLVDDGPPGADQLPDDGEGGELFEGDLVLFL
jgi:hypothetical protein